MDFSQVFNFLKIKRLMWERCDFLKAGMYFNFIIVKYINDLKGHCSSYSIQHQLMQRCDLRDTHKIPTLCM